MEPESSLPHLQKPATCPSASLYEIFCNEVKSLQPAVVSTLPSPNWRTTPCPLSATAYLLYSPLLRISGGRSSICNLRTRHNMLPGTHHKALSMTAVTNASIM